MRIRANARVHRAHRLEEGLRNIHALRMQRSPAYQLDWQLYQLREQLARMQAIRERMQMLGWL